MSTIPSNHYDAALYYAGLGMVPIPNKAGTKEMRLEHCGVCRDRIDRERKDGRKPQYGKCAKCPRLKDITTPDLAMEHFPLYRQQHPHNIGVLCHTKIMVLDVDVQDCGLEFFLWWTITQYPEWRTRLGGNKVFISPITNEKVGIDLKIGNCQALVYPSSTESGQYRWVRGPGDGPLARIDDTPFVSIMEHHEKKLLPPPRVAPGASPEVKAEVVSTVGQVPPEVAAVQQRLDLFSTARVASYDGWRDVGFALGRVSYTSTMKEMYHTWCKKWSEYKEADVDAHWVNCDPSRREHGYGMAALDRWAQEDSPERYHQMVPDTMPLLDNDSKEYFHQLGEFKDKYDNKISSADVPRVKREIEEFYCKTVAFVTGRGVLVKLVDEWNWHFELFPLSEFKSNYSGDAIYFKDDEGKEAKIEFMDVFRRIKITKLCYSYIKFQPFSPLHQVPHHPKVLNFFTGLAIDQAYRLQVAAEVEQGVTSYDPERYRADWAPWYDQTKEVICNNHEASLEYLLNALAYMVQRLVQLGIAILLQGKQGTGKTEWVRFMRRIYGDKYCDVIQREQDIKSEFTGDRRMNLIRNYEDSKGHVLHKMCGEIKNDITSDTVTSRMLFKEREKVPNKATVMITINDTCSFPFTEFERRLLALEQNPKYSSTYAGHAANFFEHNKQMAEYYASTKAQVSVYRWLLHRDISEFNPERVPMTPLMATWLAHNPSPIADFCIRLGQEYSAILQEGHKPNSKGPPTSLLHAVYDDMYQRNRKYHTWDRNKLTRELNTFLEGTGVESYTARATERNIRHMERYNLPVPTSSVEGFWKLSIEQLEDALKERHLSTFSFGDPTQVDTGAKRRRRENDPVYMSDDDEKYDGATAPPDPPGTCPVFFTMGDQMEDAVTDDIDTHAVALMHQRAATRRAK